MELCEYAKKDIKRNPAAEKIADLILNNYDVQNAKDVNEALKDVFGPIFEKMLNAEMDAHLGYDKSSSEPKETENRRNGYGEKTIHGSFGETTIAVPRIEKAHLSPSQYLSTRMMFQRLKETFWRCMPQA